jgi:DNA-binding transcriptional MerR regulator
MDWLAFLMRLRATDMPIYRMQEFARLRSEGNGTAGERRAMLDNHLEDVLAKIQALQYSSKVLKAKIEFYRNIEHDSSQERQLVKGNNDDSEPLRTGTCQTE